MTTTATINRTYRFTVTTPDGQPVFTVLIARERSEAAKAAEASPPSVPVPMPAPAPGQASSGNGEPRMTEPQRRYLFRLLAQQGVDGKAAEVHLKQLFQVATLRE